MGIDVADIRVIVHVDMPRTMLDYAQESGRAGRDREKSKGIVIKGRKKMARMERQGLENAEEELMHRFV